MGRSPCCSKEGLNRGAWTVIEDRILAAYIKAHGEGKWRNLPKRAGLKRCGKSCRLRWLNYLRPDIKRGNISHDEEELIIRLHKLLGNRWSLIAGRLPGRTDNEIKNYWNTTLGKRVGHGAHSTPPVPESESSKHSPPTTAKASKSNSKAKRAATAASTPPPPPPPPAIRTKALRCTKVVAPTTSDATLFINPPVENSLHLKPDQLQGQCTTTTTIQQLRVEYSHGIQQQDDEELEEGPVKLSCHDFEATDNDETVFKDWMENEFLLEGNGTMDLGYLASLLNCEEWP